MHEHQLELIQQVINGQTLSIANARELFSDLVKGELDEIRLTALLVGLKIKGEAPDEIAGAALAMLANATAFPATNYVCTDNCGTGGDGSHTINISTMSAIVAASLGIKMAKHGNRSVSSKSGSADVLSQLGINLQMTPEQAKQCLDQTNLTFLMAPVYHAGIRHAMPVRQNLKVRTLFNILGPLLNPAGATRQLIGVYDGKLCKPIAEALRLLGKERAWVIHGSGMDEIALHGETQITELKAGNIRQFTVSPSDFGLAEYTLEDIAGGDPIENAANIRQVLAGKGCAAHNAAIIANTAPLLLLNDMATSLQDAADKVKNQLQSGQALSTLDAFIALSNQG